MNGLIARLTWFMRQFNYKNCDNLKVSYWSVILIIMMLSEILQNGRHFVRPHIIATLARKLVWIIITFDAAKTENERKLEGNREKLRCLMILHYLQMSLLQWWLDQHWHCEYLTLAAGRNWTFNILNVEKEFALIYCFPVWFMFKM